MDNRNTSYDAYLVTPSNTVNLPNAGLYARPAADGFSVGVTGDVSALLATGASYTWVAVPANTNIPIRITRINSTGTTATNILALYRMH
jgi:hypothetical protein